MVGCLRCKGSCVICKGLRGGKQRFRCSNCGKWFCDTTGTFGYRKRFHPAVRSFAVMLCLCNRAEVVSLYVKLFFHCYVSPKSIREWTQEFLDKLPDVQPPVKPYDKAFLICHCDEKFTKVRGKQAYIWNAVDGIGNWITTLVTMARDKESAEKLYHQLKQVYRTVEIIVTDGNQSYTGLETIFGLSCEHWIRGIKPKMQMYKEYLLPSVSNNQVECLHSHIEMYLARFRHHFTTLESAQRYMKGCLLLTRLLAGFQQQHSLQQPSIPDICDTQLVREVELLVR